MESNQNTGAVRIACASMIVGICIVPVFLVMTAAAYITQTETGVVLMAIVPLILGIAGLALGLIGLIRSIRAKPRAKKGVVFAAIGIGLSLIPIVYASGLGLIVGLQML